MRNIVNTGSPLMLPNGDVLAGITGRFTLTDTDGNAVDSWDGITFEHLAGSVYFKTDADGIIWMTDSSYEFILTGDSNTPVSLWENDKGIVDTRYVCHIDHPRFVDFIGTVATDAADLPLAQFMAGLIDLNPVGYDGFFVLNSSVQADNDVLVGDSVAGKWQRKDRQTGLDLITAAGDAENEYILTKDTDTGNAVWKRDGNKYRIKASAAITKGQVVAFTGAVGASGTLTGAPAPLNTYGAYIMGIAPADIALNGFGEVVAFGPIKGLNLSAYSEGTILYYDPSVVGGFTDVQPVAPNTKVTLAAVIYPGPGGSGSLQVRVNDGGDLNDNSDVQIASAADGDVLVYDGANQKWANTQPGSAIYSSATDFATAAQGLLADSALQPGDNISELVNNSGYLVAADLGSAAFVDTTAFATAAQGATADSALQPGDNISELVNDSSYLVAGDLGSAAFTPSSDYATAEQGVALVQNDLTAQAANYTLVIGDAGKSLPFDSSMNGFSVLVPDNSSVAFIQGTTILIQFVGAAGETVFIDSANAATIINISDGTTGIKTLTQQGQAVLIYQGADTWLINGVNLT